MNWEIVFNKCLAPVLTEHSVHDERCNHEDHLIAALWQFYNVTLVFRKMIIIKQYLLLLFPAPVVILCNLAFC